MALGLFYRKSDAARVLDKKAFLVAVVEGGKAATSKLYLEPDKHDGVRRIDLPINNHFTLEPPNDPKQRQFIWCYGMPGSGKSTTLRSYALQ